MAPPAAPLITEHTRAAVYAMHGETLERLYDQPSTDTAGRRATPQRRSVGGLNQLIVAVVCLLLATRCRVGGAPPLVVSRSGHARLPP